MKASTMTIQPGEFWVADIPFTDGSGRKKRPVLVLWRDGVDYVVAAVTSPPARSIFDVGLADWNACGLRVASTVRLSRLDWLEGSLMIARIGSLTTVDADAVNRAWAAHVRPQF
jgi:PemK-like, MazF-like toxin of type II toxin-antitoxin system